MDFVTNIPPILINFLLVAIFSLIIGLSQRNLHSEEDNNHLFGTDRTFTFIGILGYILYIIESPFKILFVVGFLVLSVYFAIYYFYKLNEYKKSGLTTILIAFITYCLAPLAITQPLWLFLLIVVVVLIFTELKESLISLSKKFDRNEFMHLAKFIIFAGIILPMLPKDPILPYISSITPYKIWLAIVVVSSISYLSYLLRKFIFTSSGTIITACLGGLYSSTATTLIFSRNIKEHPEKKNEFIGGIFFAIAIMYLRILLLVLIFNNELFFKLVWILLIMSVISVIIGWFIYLKKNSITEEENHINISSKNPLEFKVALIFALLFVMFAFLNYYILKYFGNIGMNVLSFFVGISDIDPFLLNIFQGKYDVSVNVLAQLSIQAIISNNIAKFFYALFFSDKSAYKFLFIGFIILTIINFILMLLF